MLFKAAAFTEAKKNWQMPDAIATGFHVCSYSIFKYLSINTSKDCKKIFIFSLQATFRRKRFAQETFRVLL